MSFWVVRDHDGTIIGTGALKDLGHGDGEIKSTRTAPNKVRGGVASALLQHLVEHARGRGLTRLSLETGSGPFFAPARRLYEKHGFTRCPPFGDYDRPEQHLLHARAVAADLSDNMLRQQALAQ